MWKYCIYCLRVNVLVSSILMMVVTFPSINCFSDKLTVEEKINIGLEKMRRFSGNSEDKDEKNNDERDNTIKKKVNKEVTIDVPRADTNSDTEVLQAIINSLVSTERLKSNNVGYNEERNKFKKNKIQVSTPKHYMIKISACKPWTRTGVSLQKNDIVRIYCNGKVMPGGFEMVYNNTSCRAEGYHFTRGNFTVLPNARYMAAIGKISNQDAFYVGNEKEFKSYVNGQLYLGLNELKKSVYTGEPIRKRSVYWKDNSGHFDADIYVHRK